MVNVEDMNIIAHAQYNTIHCMGHGCATPTYCIALYYLGASAWPFDRVLTMSMYSSRRRSRQTSRSQLGEGKSKI